MIKKTATYTRKIITHAILSSYFVMSIGQSYAMDEQSDDLNSIPHNIIGSEVVEGWEIELGGSEQIDQLFRCIPTPPASIRYLRSANATPTNSIEIELGSEQIDQLFRCIPTSPETITYSRSVNATPTNSLFRTSGSRSTTPDIFKNARIMEPPLPFPYVSDNENRFIIPKLNDGSVISFEYGLAEDGKFQSNDLQITTNDPEQSPPEIIVQGKKKEEILLISPAYKNVTPYSKLGISAASSLMGSMGLAFLAYNLGTEVNQGIAYVLFVASLIANSVLFHKNNMGLTMGDVPFDSGNPLSRNAQTCGSGLLKFIAAGISSIPAAYVSSIVTKDISPDFSNAVYAFNFINTLFLFHKSQTAFINYFYELLELRKTKSEKVWFYKNRLEEVTALNRNEIHVLFGKFEKVQESGSKHIPDDKFEELMNAVKSSESDTTNQFWLKEGAGISFGPGLAGVFGGVYIYEVGFTLYNLFLEENGRKLSPKNVMALTYTGATILSLVQNTVQIRSTYEVFKTYAIKLSRLCESKLTERNPFLTSAINRNINYPQKLQEYTLDSLVVLLAGGAAAARAEICINYMKDPSLLTFVLAGTSIAFFSTFYWAIHSYFESMTETGVKRSEILAAIKARIVL
jgi:hypothetical protein